MSEWQDISTAPKDEVIDLWVVFPALDGDAGHELRWADAHWDAKDSDWKGGGGFCLHQFLARPYATHWMPLPAPPPSITKGEG